MVNTSDQRNPRKTQWLDNQYPRLRWLQGDITAFISNVHLELETETPAEEAMVISLVNSDPSIDVPALSVTKELLTVFANTFSTIKHQRGLLPYSSDARSDREVSSWSLGEDRWTDTEEGTAKEILLATSWLAEILLNSLLAKEESNLLKITNLSHTSVIVNSIFQEKKF